MLVFEPVSASLILLSSATKQSGVQVWPLIVGASVIATLLGTGIGFASAVSRYRLRRVELEVYKAAKDKLSTEDAEGKLHHLTQLNEALQAQISNAPLEANRLFLTRRMEQLFN